MALAMVSAFTGIPVHKDIAMTGEITLRGRVLPIGGLKSKILAAHLCGAKAVILPLKNQKDLIDVPDEIRKQMKLVLVESMEQVLEHGLVRLPKPLEAKRVEAVEQGEPIGEESPAAPDKMRHGFPGGEQPPAIAAS
jgi:ATP-dependent Lon protease